MICLLAKLYIFYPPPPQWLAFKSRKIGFQMVIYKTAECESPSPPKDLFNVTLPNLF